RSQARERERGVDLLPPGRGLRARLQGPSLQQAGEVERDAAGRVPGVRQPTDPRPWWHPSAVHLATMPDLDDHDGPFAVDDLVDNPIVALSHAVQVVTAQLLGSGRARLRGQLVHPAGHSTAMFPWNILELLDRRRLDSNPTACHDDAGP